MASLWRQWVLFSVLFVIKVNGDYVQTIVQDSFIYGKDDLQIQCKQTGLKEQDSIYSLFLSKLINGQQKEIVKIETDINTPDHFFKVLWYDTKIRDRGSVEGSKLLPATEGKLVLNVNAANVTCTDVGIYQCRISISAGRTGVNLATFAMTVPDSTIEIMDKTPDQKSVYGISDRVTLKCSAKFTTPSCIKWCFKRETDAVFSEYYSDVVYSEMTYDGCEYKRYSILNYTVTEFDIATQFVCEVSTSLTCTLPDAKKDTFILRNTNMDLIIMEVSSEVIYKKQSLNIKCFTKQIGTNDRIDRITISKVRSNSTTPLLESKYNEDKTVTTWYDNDIKGRATDINGKIFPNHNGTLSIEITVQNVQCWDAGTYRCEMILTDGRFSLEQKKINLIAKGKYVEAIASSPIRLGKDELSIECATSYFDKEDTVNQIVLSKYIDNKITALVAIELEVSQDGLKTNIRWYDRDLNSKAILDAATLIPADTSKLFIRILPEKVKCSNAGTYVCEVFASNAKHSQSQVYVNITVESVPTYKVAEQTCIRSGGQYNVGHNAILRCGGRVGNPPRIPKWCRKTITDSSFHEFISPEKTAHTKAMTSECQFESYSILEYSVTNKDDNTEFLCVSSVNECSEIVTYQAYTIRKAPGNATDDQKCYIQVAVDCDGSGNQSECDKIGGYIGAVVFLCILCAILIIVIYLLLRSR